MAVMKCKMCGGDLNVTEGVSVVECEYCGSRQTIPSQDSEKKLTLFARADRLRRACEFDKAAGVYESIVAEFPQEAEAYWGLVLCRYGIEYVDDPATGKKVPTCHRSSFDSILEDADFDQACENADAIARRQYREEAKVIEDIRKGILEVSGKEEPYDIFICYKETDENGGRTIDSVIAQDVYDALTEKGYRVFFSRISLEDKLGSEYEPYIFAALNSAKVMLAFGTDYEYFNAVWVKNEWSRFLALMAAGQKKTLIPCYKNLDAYDMPQEFQRLQAQDMGKVGAVQDLLRGIEKIIPREKEIVEKTVVVQQSAAPAGPGVESFLKRGNMSLEDGDWNKADEFFEQALNINAECAEAYLGKALAEQQCGTLQKLAEKWKNVKPKCNALTACQEDTARMEAIVNRYVLPPYLDENSIRRAIQKEKFDFTYQSAVDSWREQLDKVEAYFTSDKLMGRAVRYASGSLAEQLAAVRKEIQTALQHSLAGARQEDEESARQVKEKYAAHLEQAEKTVAQLSQQARERQEAEKQEREKRAQEREKQLLVNQRRAAVIKKVGIIVAAVAAVVIAITITVNTVIIPSGKYRDAEALLAGGDTVGAAMAFGGLDNYQDARERSMALWDEIARRDTVAVGSSHTVGLRSDGTVVATEYTRDYYHGQCDVSGWTDIMAVAAGDGHTVGLKTDGTVVETKYTGDYYHGQCDVSGWTDIVAVAANGGYHTVGLKADGTVVVAGSNSNGQCDVSDWTDVVAVAAGSSRIVGLKADSTVVAVGDNEYGQCDVSGWTGIVAVAAEEYHTVGLKADGTVVAVGPNGYGQCDVSGWTDIVAVAAGKYHTVGLKADGTVVAVGYDYNGQCDVGGWGDIVAVAAGDAHTVGLKSDGTVVAVGDNYDGQCNVSSWTGIKMPNK